MKLLYVVPRLGGAGGVQRVLLLKAGYLANVFGYDVTIVVTNDDPDEILFPVAESINVLYLKPLKGNLVSKLLNYRKELKKAVAKINPDIVTMCDNGFKSFFIRHIVPVDIPVIYEMHASKNIIFEELKNGSLLSFFKKSIFKLAKSSLSNVSKVITLTTAEANQWQLNNTVVFPNAIWFKADAGNDLLKKKIVVMARHAPQKGYDRLLSIWQQVAALFPDWHLDIYGAFNPEYDVKKMASQLPRITFNEPVKDIALVFGAVSICAMTSYNEPFGMVLLEAMECGVPCIAYDCPSGPGTIIKDGVNGFLIPDGAEAIFVEKLSEMMRNHELRLKLGREAKKDASGYNLDTIMQMWNALYRSLL